MDMNPADIPLALYVHLPWCVRKCPYCDFNSHALRSGEDAPRDEAAYVDALICDLEFELRDAEPRAIGSIFFGGGTPSLFSGAAIARILEAAAARLGFSSDIEITLEANPGASDAARFRAYRAAGVNRLSIGVQSFDDAQLKRLGRIHGSGEAVAAFEAARAAGFDNLNLDLMFALPQQTEAQARADVERALSLAPEHLSYYQLTLEPNTEFSAHPPTLPDDDSAWAIQQQAQALLAAAGYAQYEVSAYARSGKQCCHNRNYWEFGDYIGVGAGAHGKRSGSAAVVRRARHKLPRTYLQTVGTPASIQDERTVAAADLPFEFVMNALRLNDGFHFADFERRTGLARTVLTAPLNLARQRGLIDMDSSAARATAFGLNHLNALLREFIMID